jgi:hypothetical protein
MLTTILVVAALFAVYGYVRSQAECTHDCGACPKACGPPERDHHG